MMPFTISRVAGAALPLIGLSLVSAPVAAATAPSVEQYLCTFAGKCDDAVQDAVETKDAPETKGFRFARPDASAPQTSISAPEVRVFRMAKPAAATQPTRLAVRTSKPRVVGVPSMVAMRRADLTINFESGSDRMTPEGVGAARVFQQSLVMTELRSKRFRIEGHTDSVGNAGANLELSRRRAQAVADFLISGGVEASRLEVRGYGADAPLPGRRANSASNRRVEAELL